MEFFETKQGKMSLFIAQFLCVLFFVFDFVREILGIPEEISGVDLEYLEFFVVLVIVISMVITGRQVLRLRDKSALLEDKLKLASRAFGDILAQNFQQWALTASERDVALLAIKGFGISQIAHMRQTKDGTIKAQLNQIYKKAGVTGRPQLISHFVEELMSDELAEAIPGGDGILR